MALITCPECGHQISEKADNCPNCGCPNPLAGGVNSDMEVNKPHLNKNNRKRKFLIALCVVGMILFLIGKKVREKYYAVTYQNTANMMLDGCVDAEESISLIHDVWNNAIWEERDSETDKYTRKSGEFVDDFNDALENLFSDDEFMREIEKLQNNQQEVKQSMKKLKNPPRKYKDEYKDIKELYKKYLEFTNMAINPRGSLESFTKSFNNLDTELVEEYEKIEMNFD